MAEAREMMMTPSLHPLLQMLSQHDLALARIVDRGGPERREPQGIVEQVYLSRQEISGGLLKPGAELGFIKFDWECVPESGKRALILARLSGGKFSMGGILRIEEIDHEPYVLWDSWKREDFSPWLRAHTRPAPRHGMSVIRFDTFEAVVQEAVDKILQGYTYPPPPKPYVQTEDCGLMSDGCLLHFDLTNPATASDVTAFVYRRAREDEIVARQHAAIVARLRRLGSPFNLAGRETPAPLFADGGYWTQTQDEANAVTMSGWYTFRDGRVLEDKAVDDDNFHYKFNALDARLDYRALIHEDFKQAIVAIGGYRAVWNYSRYGRAYRRGYLDTTDESCFDDNDFPIGNAAYDRLCADKTIDVDGRNNIFTLYPAQYWDAELCQRALGYGPEEVIKRLQGKAPQVKRLGDGVYLVLNDDPKMSFDDFQSMNERHKGLLGLK